MTHKGKPECVRIAISQPDGNVAIMQFICLVKRNAEDPGYNREPTPENIEAEITKSNIAFTSWRIISDDEIPQDRTFRNAWTDNGTGIEHDMDKARAIHMDRIRTSRNVKLEETDKLVAKFDGAPVPEELKTQRQKLRDIPQAIDLNSAKTVEQLKTMWPAELA